MSVLSWGIGFFLRLVQRQLAGRTAACRQLAPREGMNVRSGLSALWGRQGWLCNRDVGEGCLVSVLRQKS
ncbi:hypothetical protein ACIQWZ_38760 [Streptomyces sp. NPDC098077]|uniref:hypothetical protein n=1 Tax=Streptomyces sp. NPDC098077 TaxID=3366093 RepID=UPI00382D7FF4